MKLFKVMSLFLFSILIGGAILTGCQDKGSVVAVVNGENIYEYEFNIMLSDIEDVTEDDNEQALNLLISTKTMEQYFKDKKIDISNEEKELRKITTEEMKVNKDHFGNRVPKEYMDLIIKHDLMAFKISEDEDLMNSYSEFFRDSEIEKKM